MIHNILVALDNSEFADRVMTQAIDLAKVFNSKITAVSVVDYSVMTNVDANGVVVMPEILDAIRNSFELALGRFSELAKKANLEFKTELLNGSLAGRIVQYSKDNDTDLIVIGHVGKSAVSELLLGSVAHKVSNYSKCSVFVVK
jgi:nucleotide-binding universal stress UspA family protein